MRKTIFLLLVAFFGLCSYLQAQTKPEEREYEKLRYWRDVGTNEAFYTAVRIGEYYWIDNNMNHQKAHQYGPDWHIPRYEVNWVTEAQLDKYFNNMKLDRTQVPAFTADNFNKYYGAYYHEHSIYGTITPAGVYVARMDNPREMSIKKLNEETGQYNIATASNYKIASRKDWQQLIGMIPQREGTLSLDILDVRSHLSYKSGEVPIAKDFWTDSFHRTFWFEIGRNSYGFNMLPGGGRVDYYKTESLVGYPSWELQRGDLYQLYQVAKYATVGDDGGAESLDFEDYIHFYPNSIEPEHIDNGTWYNVRFCRPLTVEELGYRLFYNNNEDNPNIIKRTNDLSDATPPTGYTELENGYLRGFYVMHILDNPNPKYSLREVVRMSKCVVEFGSEIDPEYCACDPDTYLIESLTLKHDQTSRQYSHTIVRDEEFTVIAPSTKPEELKIGFFDKYGKFLERIDIEDEREGDHYKCMMVKTSKAQEGIVQAYFEKETETEFKRVEVGRLLTDEYFSHIIDQLYVNYVLSPNDTQMRTFAAAATSDDQYEVISLTGHFSPFFSHRASTYDRFVYSVEQINEEFYVRAPYDATKGDLHIGLYTINGEHLCDIDTKSELISGGNAKQFTCAIPSEDKWKMYLYPESEYVMIPNYYPNDNKNQEPKKVTKFTHERTPVDRLPIFVKTSYGSTPEVKPKELTLLITPNPTSDAFEILGDFEKVEEVKVYSLSGGLVRTVKSINRVDITNFPSGVYKVIATTDKGTATGTVLKK